MVEIIAGQKGKGKTKYLLEKANNAIKDAKKYSIGNTINDINYNLKNFT